MIFLCVLFAFSAIFLVFLLRSSRPRSKLPLPPGPKKLPLLGNLLQLPSEREWETYMKWSQEYKSDIIHLNAAGTSIIVLSSVEAANDLLEKRSNKYSDRPPMPMVSDLMGWNIALGFMNYGHQWRTDRKLFHQALNARTVQNYHSQERAACHELLRRLLQDPSDIMEHLRHMAAQTIMLVAYGIDILPHDDPFVALAREALHTVVIAGVPGRFFVDVIPALKYMPDWLPGAGFKRLAKRWRRMLADMHDLPFAEAKRIIASGNASNSFIAVSLNNTEGLMDREEEETVKRVAGNMYIGGADTTVSVLGTFILAMLANPEAQKKAQAEIDSVIDDGELPDFKDQESLPYVSALVKEVLRWRSATPIAVPHYLSVEDEYKGCRLPAGSIVISNAWAMLHDEVMYPDPYSFKPERFLLDGVPNPAVSSPEVAFGFGRRVCPGRHMAQDSVWINVVSILATFNITKAVGDDRQVIEPTYEYYSGLITIPLPFKCSIKPRSKRAADLIRANIGEGRL
ncbi:Cytochrome P450 [Mycena sanguinolenta]|uniref:Cytochrome P450 n=1 Tax=Mycena sanguinolenta TaxID=230812 RepID=A0A8H6Z8J3_9AGAR|nr:Cytochrome P450 [Mycena sanguinolenta]